jgi:hypothetical protein
MFKIFMRLAKISVITVGHLVRSMRRPRSGKCQQFLFRLVRRGPQSLRILAESVSTTVDMNPSGLDLNPFALDPKSSVLVLNLSVPIFIWPDWMDWNPTEIGINPSS